ncbi:ATP-binding protein [Neptunomonas sp. XY-337]|uniref:sensor histidine kinase n=1 Tax=Neptunomonas sp. XY-337 TaxID=2561897 RepID=UPI0010AA3E43|nr:ATP-binding protein [Neptunomonas sp. XY-337]
MSDMPASTSPLLIVSLDQAPLASLLSSLNHATVSAGAPRAIKKALRNESTGVIVFLVTDPQSAELAEQGFDYIRHGLADKDRLLVAAHSSDYEPNALHWIEAFDINHFLCLEPAREEVNCHIIQRCVKTWSRTVQLRAQYRAESDLLMSVTRLSRSEERLPDLLASFCDSLAQISCAAAHCRISIDRDGSATLKHHWPQQEQHNASFTKALQLPSLPSYLQRALTECKPQIDLLPEQSMFSALADQLERPLSSYLVFPLVVYDRVIELMVFLIPEDAMDSVSIRQIDVITKASEQLTMLLERREAERRLKQQYIRLKNTLVELKQTQTQLAHSEKMATVGQLAAGIAHEINNPLAFVLSNFGSMNEYLDSIFTMQSLHEQFLAAIDHGNQSLSAELKTQISASRGEMDMEFVCDDIRDIVAESRDGLNRVKEIIADLQSFARGNDATPVPLDLATSINQTLKLLKPFIDEQVTIQVDLAEAPDLKCHAGFVQQILTNLIKNALQALQGISHPDPNITISSRINGETLFISVRDNGPGIAPDAQKKVFDPFYTTKQVGKGTGLGLSVTYNLARKLGGDIALRSNPNEFCEFTLSLPYPEQQPQGAPASKETTPLTD